MPLIAGSTSCLASEESLYPTGATGLKLIQAVYNVTAASWQIDLAYSKGSQDTVAVLYLPRATRDAGGLYTAQFNASFQPGNFPCRTSDLAQKAATTCCLNDFAVGYRAISTLTLPGGLECTPPYAAPPPLTTSDAVYGQFGPDMPKSFATALLAATGQTAGVGLVRVSLDSAELRTSASAFSGAVGADELFSTFVGLAMLTPTGGRVLDASAQQVLLSLSKSDYFTVAASGTNAYTFLSYVNVRVHEVLDGLDPAGRSQYAAVSFVLGAGFTPNADTGLVPAASVRVGMGPTKSQAAWASACRAPVPAAFSARMAQSCGPAVGMCGLSPAFSLADRFVTVNVPLLSADGGALFNLSDPGAQSVFVQLSVSASGADGTPAVTTIDAAVPVMQGGVGTWCYGLAAKTQAQDMIDSVDLVVGAAGNPTDLARLTRLTGLQRPSAGGRGSAAQNISARSVESGLLTLVVRGKDAAFAGGAAAPVLGVDDVVTLHIMGDSLSAAVTALLASPAPAFQVVFDQVRGRASLSASPALAELCRPTANQLPLASCVLRYDVQGLVPNPATALAVGSATAATASAFMQGVAGPSDFSAALGANFSALLRAQYQLDPQVRHRIAVWINPGFAWAGPGTTGKGLFSLSQRVVVVALLSVAGGANGRRRLLVASSSIGGPAAPATGSATVDFGVGLEGLLADRLGLPADRVSVWSIALSLTPAQACLPAADLHEAAKAILLQSLARAAVASPVADVYISDSAVTLAGTVCPAGRRQAVASGSGASGQFETVVAFQAGTEPPRLDAALLARMPGVLSVRPVRVSPLILTQEAAAASPAAGELSRGAAEVGRGASPTLVGSLCAVGAVLLAAAAAVLLLIRRRRTAKLGDSDGPVTDRPADATRAAVELLNGASGRSPAKVALGAGEDSKPRRRASQAFSAAV
jgi:hypothetical protein